MYGVCNIRAERGWRPSTTWRRAARGRRAAWTRGGEGVKTDPNADARTGLPWG